MRMYKLLSLSLVIYFLFIGISGCNKSKNNLFYSSFPNNISLLGKALETDSIMLRYPFRIKHHDSLAIIMDLHHPDYFYHAFSYPQFKYLSSFGKRGQAPEGYLSVENFRLAGKEIWGLDANKSRIKKISLQSVDEGKEKATKKIALNKDIIRALDFALYNDSCFIIPDYSGKRRFHIIDKNGNIKSGHGKIPTLKHKSKDIALAQAWRSFIDYNPDNGILAMATQLGEVLEIYNLKDSTHIVKIGPHGEPEYNETGGMAIPVGIMGYSDIHVGNDAIYTVFWGTSFKEIQKDPFNTPQGGNIIQVFSLDGKPVKQYVLDRHITGFSFDEKNGKMIALDVNSDHQIIEYQLSSNSTK